MPQAVKLNLCFLLLHPIQHKKYHCQLAMKSTLCHPLIQAPITLPIRFLPSGTPAREADTQQKPDARKSPKRGKVTTSSTSVVEQQPQQRIPRSTSSEDVRVMLGAAVAEDADMETIEEEDSVAPLPAFYASKFH
jgi:hypothetical protein